MRSARPLLILTLTLAALAACSSSRLPEYAAPKGRVIDPAAADLSDVISYRKLVRADFKGSAAPPEFAANADKIGAATCAHIMTTPDTQVRIQAAVSPDGKPGYRAIAEHIRFLARMDRNCSWWNPADLGLPKDYILEHEQIHFALFELEARRLNESVPELKKQLNASADSIEEVSRMVQQQLEDAIRSRLKDILARTRAFDEDTSMGHNPREQKRWWDRVQAELARTTRYAR